MSGETPTPRRILFVTGTRADFGKLKPLIRATADDPLFSYTMFATGMHMLRRYGMTVIELAKSNFTNVYQYINQVHGDPMEHVLASTITGLSRYVHEHPPDLIVAHGDRVEALATAITGALRNIRVAHVEGGELSGTVDESLRHAVSKLAHIHFVANEEAAGRLRQMGEAPNSIFVIGSPDIDIMLSPHLPSLDEAREYYKIPWREYGVILFHPVTTETATMHKQAEALVSAAVASGKNFIVIYPNNDEGCDDIFQAYRHFEGDARFRVFPSLRFELFLSLLKHAKFILGNSSAGVREAPVYGVPAINVGTRQEGRSVSEAVINVPSERDAILKAIDQACKAKPAKPDLHFGDGKSDVRFLDVLRSEQFWNIPLQKRFHDTVIKHP